MAYSYVNSVTDTTGYVGTSKTMPAMTVTSGDLLIVVTHTDNATTSCAGNGNTYTLASQIQAGGEYVSVFYSLPSNSGSTAVVISATHINESAVLEYSGIGSYINSVNHQNSSPGAGANTITSTNVNVTSQPAMLFGAYLANDTTLVTAGTSPLAFTSRILNLAGTGFAIGAEDVRVTATGNAATTFGNTNNATYLAIALAFTEVASLVTTPPVGSEAYAGQSPTGIRGSVLTPLTARSRHISLPHRAVSLDHLAWRSKIIARPDSMHLR